MNRTIICLTCKKEIVGRLTRGNKSGPSYIRACTDCEKLSFGFHNQGRKIMQLSVLPWTQLKKWQDEMIADFERQMKGLSARILNDPDLPKKEVKSFNRIRVEE